MPLVLSDSGYGAVGWAAKDAVFAGSVHLRIEREDCDSVSTQLALYIY